MGVFPNAITACTPNYCMRLKAIDHLYRLAFAFSMRFLFIMPLLDLNVINALEEHQFGYVRNSTQQFTELFHARLQAWNRHFLFLLQYAKALR